jgi:spore coat protein H
MKKFLKVSALALLGVLTVVFFGAFEGGSQTVRSPTDAVLFPHDRVIDVYIEVDEAELQHMFDQARMEEYIVCNVVYNGYRIKNVAIRPKGNSSLMQAANSTSNRYSFKLDFNHYVKGQNLFGITKINLNNGFSDPSFMREYLTYEISEMLGLETPRTTYIALHINNQYFGLYLGVENIDENFVRDHFAYGYGDLYKPEGTGANLVYIDDDPQSYPGLALQTNEETSDRISIVEMLKVLQEGTYEELEKVLDIDSFLKYYALCVAAGSMDSILGGMNHNYYLYDRDGQFVMLPWDFNMAFGGFGGDRGSGGSFYIDTPAVNMASLPIVNRLLTREEYLERYHGYLQLIIDGYLNDEFFAERVEEVAAMIDPYVKDDPTALYSYEQFLASFNSTDGRSTGLIDYNSARVETILKQLSGEIPSKSDGSDSTASSFFERMPMAGNEGWNVPANAMPVRDNRNAENIDPLEMLPEDTLIQLIKEWETVASSETGDATSQELVDFESDAEENVTVVKGHEITAEMREWMLQRMESQMANIAVQNRNVQNPDAMRFGAAREERVQNMQPPDTQPPQGMPFNAAGRVDGRANMQPPSEMPDFDMGNRARGEAEQIPEKSDDLTRSETITIYASMLALGLSITILKLKRKI